MENNDVNSHPSVGTKRPVSAISQQAPAPGPTIGVPGPSPPPSSAPSGAAVAGSSSAGPVSNGGGTAAAAAAATAPTRDEPKVKPAYGKDMQILEVTNNGDPANMEMLIHLKVSIARVYRASVCVTEV